MEESYVFGALEREKNSMRKIILTTVLIGLGINIIASGLSNITKNDDAYIFQIIFGLVLSVVVLECVSKFIFACIMQAICECRQDEQNPNTCLHVYRSGWRRGETPSA